jgi:predicted Rossmann-fold nucleotide-binding protein
LEELFEMWTAGSLGMHDKPVIMLDPVGFYEPLWVYLEALRDKGFVRQAALDLLHRVTTVEAAFDLVE